MKIKAEYKGSTVSCSFVYVPSIIYDKKDLVDAIDKLDLLEMVVEAFHRNKRPTVYIESENKSVSDYTTAINVNVKIYNGKVANLKLDYNPNDPPVKKWKMNGDFNKGVVEILETFTKDHRDNISRIFNIYTREIKKSEKKKLGKRLENII